ncbi:MAG: tRNA (adenosine(37)-N6)-threonylcarbamoyltransferase complex dimerization subunit type 1 TsaB [Cyanobacteria bacterium K_DeepCast_35m_m2_023]|nr:tRNA (adenosine(37)-N6)-threonylcarbamoyltransferase complex dimerization subunit type 1 TsaB [Cyanobacteria bacterium K_DeepCast_35m_m2_023]
MSWLLALHSSSPVLGVGLLDLNRPQQPPQAVAFDLGRGLSNRLLSCLEEVLPASQWPALARLAVATGPGGFTGTRLTVVLARTLAQQLRLPLDGISSFQLIATRLQLSQPTWLQQTLPRRGVVAGLYGPDPSAAGALAELQPPRLFRSEIELQQAVGTVAIAEAAVQLPGDVEALLRISARRAGDGRSAAPWQTVLPIYPTSPVES